jgi:signal peptidase I
VSNRKFILLVLILGLAGSAYLIGRMFLIQTALVPGGAMANTIVAGDHVLLVKAFGGLERGQVVVFQFPRDSNSYIKRVVGLPGETIQFRGRTIYINERPLSEQKVLVTGDDGSGNPMPVISKEGAGPYPVFYSRSEAEEDPSLDMADFATHEPFRVPADNYFLMGDNRDNSEDSRYRGPVPRNLIWGTAVLIYYSQHNDRIFKRIK